MIRFWLAYAWRRMLVCYAQRFDIVTCASNVAQLWLAWDAAAGQYVPAEGQLGASAAAGQPDATASAAADTYQPDGSAAAADTAPSAVPTSTDAYTPLPAGYALAEPAAGPAAATDGGAGPVAVAAGAQKAPGRRRGATIGSAPQLSQQGLQAALRQAEVRLSEAHSIVLQAFMLMAAGSCCLLVSNFVADPVCWQWCLRASYCYLDMSIKQ